MRRIELGVEALIEHPAHQEIVVFKEDGH